MTDPYIDPDDYSDISENEISATQHLEIPLSLGGERLDAALAKLLPDFSRSRLTQWIKDGQVKVDGQVVAPKTKMLGGEKLEVSLQPTHEEMAFQPEAMDLPIVFEDDHILVINKPAGLVVHPASGNWSGTLLNGLLNHCPSLAGVPRAGIVHRLDKDTSGLMVVAKTVPAQTDLVRQMQARSVKRVYRAIADGVVPFDGTIDANIGRDPHNRLKMAVLKFGGKPAITHLRVLERFASHSYVECKLETGRTHQIRVHMREAGHPLSGDPVYGNLRHKMDEDTAAAVKALGRQALHAYALALVHPASGELRSWKAPLPDDFRRLLDLLRGDGALPDEEAFAHADEQDDEDWDDDDDDDGDIEVIYAR
ncbi:23S rRNA pseudouridine(1911/1915/1917) synthase RluD [Chromobacterium subtsugae]|uniref:Pseudouridine synthase n=1 Tax=Chromobacterium subtsugae TaxID=251747 RepID=A0ABS7FGA9_9NEIS|nr:MULTISPECIES: 23S rRNA pseudouridine(1911/1915/1917) synthase RluD [Chromobacterium]KUM02683.1 pseudouridine synthase [Chromobacterium subtsugae]KZE84901.1 RNA pseudouridine synthase [Chromobacterium sp. F49]MBW7567887.1 23S rRNA pseudouridine(1911/1915/1917) synthase RluD [Chromobacterium subtsugae]MBW8289114.1 23S rRNA pseudouridine(1911/1915/1917) synthase RluD [Chromobacterium subtsugae]WSE93742.1 23S rRNA pseudouridine(1911/1915/1917) synthase RluD [Chromobacterium subtsugae]